MKWLSLHEVQFFLNLLIYCSNSKINILFFIQVIKMCVHPQWNASGSVFSLSVGLFLVSHSVQSDIITVVNVVNVYRGAILVWDVVGGV